MRSFAEANKTMHPVEKQWHYPILTSYGFTALTRDAEGFVRSYKYANANGIEVTCTTGCSAEYWVGTGARGYWEELEPWLKTL